MPKSTKPVKEKRAVGLGPRESLRRWLRVWQQFRPYARQHRASFIRGLIPSLAVVGCHLALPWPIKTLLDGLLKDGQGQMVYSPLELGAAFFFLTILLAAAEFQQRLWVARFSIGWVRDIRAEAFQAASRVDPRRFNIGTGDLVARLIGDTARLKAGLKGFLTHFATNGLLFVGVTVVLFLRAWQLSLIFLVAGFAVMLITWWGTWRLYNRYRVLRRKEGKLAMRIEDALGEGSGAAEFAKVNRSSGRHEASVVQIQGQTTFLAHVILGAATLLSLWIGMHLVESKVIPAGDLVLVTLYALKMSRPGVRLARQGTRMGKMLALGDRLERLLREAALAETKGDVPPLQESIRLEGVSLESRGKHGRGARLAAIDVVLKAGERVAVVGPSGSGKSSLLDVIAAETAPSSGRLRWDGVSYKKLSYQGLSARIAFQAESPFWLRKPLRDHLRVDDVGLDEVRHHLAICGLGSFLEHLPNGLDTVLGADDLSAHEARALTLVRVLSAHDKDLVLLDEPFASLTLRQIHAVLDRFAQDRWRTMVIAMTRPVNLSWFDRIIELRAGKITFDGKPRAWQLATEEEVD